MPMSGGRKGGWNTAPKSSSILVRISLTQFALESVLIQLAETYSVSFGTGARSCPGKYLAQTVYRKMIPMLFQDMEWSFVDPNAEKVLQCTFSVRYIKMMMKWKLREQTV